MKSLVFQHPNTVSGVAVDGTGIATSCFDGYARRFNLAVSNQPIETRQGAIAQVDPPSWKQLNAVALRGEQMAHDDGFDTHKEGVAITAQGYVVHPIDFNPPTGIRITAISKDGRYGVGTDLICYDRFTGQHWQCVMPFNQNHTPMAVEVLPDGTVVIGSLDGYVRLFKTPTDFMLILPSPAGVGCLDVSADGKRIVVGDWDRGVTIYDAATLMQLAKTSTTTLPHGVRFYGNDVLIGTHAGELLRWDGVSDAAVSAPIVVTKKGRRK